MTLNIDGTVRVPQGDAKVVPFTLTSKSSGDPLDVENLEISWKLQDTRTREDILSLDDVGVSIIYRDSTDGGVEIKLETGATSGMRATDYREVLEIVEPNGDQTTWVGDSTFILTEDS